MRIGQKARVRIFVYRIVDDVLENIDRRMVLLHGAKVAAARQICSSLYEGFATL